MPSLILFRMRKVLFVRFGSRTSGARSGVWNNSQAVEEDSLLGGNECVALGWGLQVKYYIWVHQVEDLFFFKVSWGGGAHKNWDFLAKVAQKQLVLSSSILALSSSWGQKIIIIVIFTIVGLEEARYGFYGEPEFGFPGRSASHHHQHRSQQHHHFYSKYHHLHPPFPHCQG